MSRYLQERMYFSILGDLALIGVLVSLMIYAVRRIRGFGDDFPIVNRKYVLEPAIFARVRWALWSKSILENAHTKYGESIFRIFRGDTDVLVLPADFVPELNAIPDNILSSRYAHIETLAGYLNKLDGVLYTNVHVKLITSRLTPAIPRLWTPLCARIEDSIYRHFPIEVTTLTQLELLEKFVSCIGRAMCMFIVGFPESDNPKVPQLAIDLAKNTFELAFIGRTLPRPLQEVLIWLFPQKWRVERAWRGVKHLVTNSIEQRREKLSHTKPDDLLSCMVQSGCFEDRCDEIDVLYHLLGAMMAGSIHSTANVTTAALIYLAASPNDLEELRTEIRLKNTEINGQWSLTAINGLDKLDSALKEAQRLVPGATLNYSRRFLYDHKLSNGMKIKKGQIVSISTWTRSMDPQKFPEPDRFMALRAYNKNLEEHRAEPYRSLDNQEIRWGSGRWGCAGRHLASAVMKLLLIKLIDEYDLTVPDGPQPKKVYFHEFVFLDPRMPLVLRRREKNSGIRYPCEGGLSATTP